MSNILMPDFLRSIVEKLEIDIPVVSSSYDLTEDITTFNVCKTYHAFYCGYVYDGASKYQITGIENNSFIQVNGDLTAIEILTIQKPFFRHGTPLQIESVMANIRKYSDKLPMIWLVEPFSTYDIEDRKSKIAYDADITLLFVLPIGNEDWCVEEQYQNIIAPIDNMICEFRECIRKSTLTENFNGRSKRVNRVNMGEWVSKGGARKPMEDNIKRLLDELVTVTEYSTSFSIKKKNQCCSK